MRHYCGMGTQTLERIVDEAARQPVDPAVLENRYRGVLLGVAAGNCLGSPVEGQSASAIRRHYPDGVRDIDPAEHDRAWDDDLAQTVLVAETLIEDEEMDPDRLGARLVEWSRDNGRGIGVLTRQVLGEIAGGKSAAEASLEVWEQSGWSTAGNGAVMRCSPVALRWRRSGAALVRNARASALATHYDARCEWSTVAFSVALACILSGGDLSLDELASALEEAAGTDWAAAGVGHVVEAIREVPKRGLRELRLDDPMDMGYTLKAMQVGLWCLVERPELEQGLIAVVSFGGDADTNGAVAGAALGACAGADELPRRWLRRIGGADYLAQLADRLHSLSGG